MGASWGQVWRRWHGRGSRWLVKRERERKNGEKEKKGGRELEKYNHMFCSLAFKLVHECSTTIMYSRIQRQPCGQGAIGFV